ncbi:sugar transferase [Desulfobacterales bacterium HSG16]|nr:sugar transferase [Desulfobacterales bacterium HSG16]
MEDPQEIHYKEKLGLIAIQILDVCLVLTLFFCIREYYTFGHLIRIDTFYRVQFSIRHFASLIVMAIIWNRFFAFMQMYKFRQMEGWVTRMVRTMMASSLSVATVVFGAELVGVTQINRPFPLVFWIISTSSFVIFRAVVFSFLHILRKQKKNLIKVLIVGINNRSIDLARELSRPEMGYEIIGFADDGMMEGVEDKIEEVRWLSTLKDLDDYISNNHVDEVIAALPIRTFYDQTVELIKICAMQGIRVKLMSDMFDLPVNLPHTIECDSSVYINYDVNPRTELQQDLKRFSDLAISGVALLLLSPVMLIVALAIIANDGLPIFFVQERVGLNKKRYKMFKFRTMVVNAEKQQEALEKYNESDGAAFKLTNDPRVTKLGNFLRKTSLDELPQLLNALIGNMSVVGPRPLPIRDFERFYDDSHRRRFSVKPGITGLWQVSGRSDVDFQEWMLLDLQYIDEWSIFQDFMILIKTIPAVIARKGAR